MRSTHLLLRIYTSVNCVLILLSCMLCALRRVRLSCAPRHRSSVVVVQYTDAARTQPDRHAVLVTVASRRCESTW